MKKLPSILIIVFLCLGSDSLTGQTYLYLDNSFKETATIMPVKRKGLGSGGKYEFGPYRVIASKKGWTNTKTRTDFFGANTNAQSQTNSSFLFTGEGTDTVIANINYTSIIQINELYGFVFRTLTNWSYLEHKTSEVYMASYSSTSDTSNWNLVLAYPVEEEIFGAASKEMISRFKGTLANVEMSIDIIPEFRWETGKSASVLKPLEAYIFVLDGATIVAVQAYPSTKKFVWVKEDLPVKLKQILAAAAVTMLMRSDHNLSE